MKILRLRNRLYIPAISIILVVVILLGFTWYSTYQNLNRAEKRAVESAYRQGSIILNAIESGARAGTFMPLWGEDAIGRLLIETAKDEDILYIYLVDTNGVVMHHSNTSLDGSTAFWTPDTASESQPVYQILKSSEGKRSLAIAKRFKPISSVPEKRMHLHGYRIHEHKNDTLVLGLSMDNYDQAKADDIHHAYLMAAIVLALGTGTFFFIFVIQNYYLVGKTLKQTQDYAREIIYSMADGLIGIDLAGRVTTYNQIALDILGLGKKDIRGSEVKNYLNFDRLEIGGTLERGQPILNREISLTGNPENSPIPLSLSVTPIRSGRNEIAGAVILIKDLREIKRLENDLKRAETLAAVGKMAAIVAHEIRNPLSSIKGFAQLLKKTLQSVPETHEYTELMVGEVERINSVIEDLLFFSRPAEPKCQPTDVHRLCDDCIRLLLADANSDGLHIVKRYDAHTDPFIIDKNQMTQALLNLLLNALDAVSVGGTITVFTETSETGDVLKIGVEDDGSGIQADIRGDLFKPFHTTKEKGSGLGLSIVKKIAEAHGGEITVASPTMNHNRGSRFVLVIPATENRPLTEGG